MTIATLLATIGGLLFGIALGSLLTGARRRPSATGGPLVLVARWSRRWAPRWLPVPTAAARRIAAAGLSPGLTPLDLRALRGAGAAVGIAIAIVVMPVVGGRGALLLLGGPTALALLPDLVLRRRASRRGAAIARGLPDAIDLLRIALRSGRSVPEALALVGAHLTGDLGRELRRAGAEIRLGVRVEPALVGLRDRCPADGAAEAVALLLRAHRQGAVVVDSLATLAEDLRERAARTAIDHAARAAPRIQLVVALLLVPAAMLLIAAALLRLLGRG